MTYIVWGEFIHSEMIKLFCFTFAMRNKEETHGNLKKKIFVYSVQNVLNFFCLTFCNQELRGDTWRFEEKAICFVGGQLQGGPEEFVQWATETYGYEDYRPSALYQTLTEEAYKSCLNKENVCQLFV